MLLYKCINENIQGRPSLPIIKSKPEERLLDALFGNITEEESKYLVHLLPKMETTSLDGSVSSHSKGKISVKRARELFLKRFPKTKWMKH
jgi:hypothetical protein